jgi:hypothetical protein
MPFYFHQLHKQPLEYSVAKILYINKSAFTNETYSGKKPPKATEGGRRIFTWGHQCKATFEIQAVTASEPATGRGTDLKMETLPRISCVTFQEFW